MVSKTNFKGALTKDIKERITLKDIIKEREANKKHMERQLKEFRNRKIKS